MVVKTLYQPIIQSIYPDEKKAGRYQIWNVDVAYLSKEAAYKDFERRLVLDSQMRTFDDERDLDAGKGLWRNHPPTSYKIVGWRTLEVEFDREPGWEA